MLTSLNSIKNILINALDALPEWSDLTNPMKGKVIDQTFKSILKDLMDQFGMQPGKDYEDNLRDNEVATDFVTFTERADDLIRGLMNGKIIVIKEHNRVSKLGNTYTVKPHFRRIA